MKTTVRILLIEDSPHDALLIERQLAAAQLGFELKQVLTERELRKELESRPPDLILSDHGLPSFTGFSALEIVRDRFPQLPFIFVSGSNDQAMVVEMYDRGATDYVFKGDLHELDEAVFRALDSRTFSAEIAANPSTTVGPANTKTDAAVSRLYFCPTCVLTYDDKGVVVPLNHYLGSHQESIVMNRLCAECERLHQWKGALSEISSERGQPR